MDHPSQPSMSTHDGVESIQHGARGYIESYPSFKTHVRSWRISEYAPFRKENRHTKLLVDASRYIRGCAVHQTKTGQLLIKEMNGISPRLDWPDQDEAIVVAPAIARIGRDERVQCLANSEADEIGPLGQRNLREIAIERQRDAGDFLEADRYMRRPRDEGKQQPNLLGIGPWCHKKGGVFSADVRQDAIAQPPLPECWNPRHGHDNQATKRDAQPGSKCFRKPHRCCPRC